MNKDVLEKSLKYTTINKKALGESVQAGCYYCLKVYPAYKVVDFVEADETGICPYCNIDCVLPDKSPYELTRENLQELHAFWF
ncbi:cytoplasmic protein [Cytophagaceae bacterium YF14B1]|uniref:Cytoplasmic protein n=1 Tax=Xanthocytophaga flava TaxID=3048013 RepID=A0AAE3QS02_9BACT|nr:cytoplasmic protein [Xanthocytophaga flavus]MDJ1484260.1 cytoplasmic protein [Xanthocytophaga flavus]